ncbi:MAG: patatin-like phospholipase family protein [Ferruginibacter sp.]|nr:patatin-like phospholipase family protein [Ferruginibacter sp.]
MKKLVILIIIFPTLCFSQITQIKYNYKNLVLEGGGVRGLAYAGAFSKLEKDGILQQLEKVAGTSAGAIAGIMICVGYSATEIDSIMRSLPVEEFNDGRGGIVGKYRRVRNKFGLYKGQKFELWVQQLIKYKTGDGNLTFAQLHQLHLQNNLFKDFYCTATNLSRQQLDIFSYEHTPGLSIALAVRISGGLPLYFEPIILDDQYRKIEKTDTLSFKNYYVDGGMIANYPISIFDTCDNNGNPLQCDKLRFNRYTLGIKLERPAQIDSIKKNSSIIPPFEIRSLNDYIHAFNNLVIETLNRKYPNLENEKKRTIYVSYGSIRSRVRKMKPAEKEMLYNNGVQAATDFLNSK